jgi:diacylglycerol kinase (ATP)
MMVRYRQGVLQNRGSGSVTHNGISGTTAPICPMSRTRIERLYEAFFNTLAGLSWAVRHERAVQEECVVLAVALPASFVVAASAGWWLALIGSLLLLLLVELLNTAIEKLSDHVTPEQNDGIKVVKDLGSAAVFCALTLAFLVWAAGLWARCVP